MLDFELNGCEFETHRMNCVVPLSQIGEHWVSPENDGSFGEGGYLINGRIQRLSSGGSKSGPSAPPLWIRPCLKFYHEFLDGYTYKKTDMATFHQYFFWGHTKLSNLEKATLGPFVTNYLEIG